MIWDQAAIAMGQPPTSYSTTAAGRELEEEERVDAAQPPTMANPMSGPMQLASSLWGSYGPGILAGGMALISGARAQAQASGSGSSAGAASGGRKRPGASVLTTPPSSRIRASGHGRQPSVEERKRQLEAELAALEAPTTVIEGLPGGSGTTSRSSSDSVVKRKGHVRNRSGSGGSGKFEEVEVPSDVEGYDVGDNQDEGAPAGGGGGGGGWFSGWGAGAKGYERVKSD